MDCSKTIDFFFELKRLCDSRADCEADAANQEQCPMFEVCNYSLPKICAKDVIKVVESLQNGATNTRGRHTHRTSLRSSQKRKANQTEPRLYAEKESTAENAKKMKNATITRGLVRTAGTSQWRNNNARNKRCSA